MCIRDRLAPVCDAATRVIIIGRMNDVALYRELVRRGVSDYLIAPVGALQIVRAVCGLFSAPDAKPVGRVIAVVGAKGGVGASTIAHNIAFGRPDATPAQIEDAARTAHIAAEILDFPLGFSTLVGERGITLSGGQKQRTAIALSLIHI